MVEIRRGFDPADAGRATALYWQAFGAKLGTCLGPTDRAHAFVTRVMRADHALSAYEGDRLLGLAGFKTAEGAFVGGDFKDMVAIYGPVGAAWRAATLSLLERDVDNDRFLMDGIFVAPEARGKGVGTQLLRAICAEADARGYDRVRLDVVDSNDGARALYEREGFEAVKRDRTGLLRLIFGFASSTTMVKTL